MISVNNCVIINLDSRPDLFLNLEKFKNNWGKQGKIVERISGVEYKNKTHIINYFLKTNRLNLNGCGFRHSREAILGEFGCYMSHYNCWKYVVDNKLSNCLILEDGIELLRSDFENLYIDTKLDILFINEEMTTDINKNLTGYGLQGYIVTQKGAQLLMRNCQVLTLPIDLQIRHLCNTKEICYDISNKPFVKRDNNRVSSIDGIQLSNNIVNLNDKQNPNNILQRMFFNFLAKNVNLDEYI